MKRKFTVVHENVKTVFIAERMAAIYDEPMRILFFGGKDRSDIVGMYKDKWNFVISEDYKDK